LFFPRAPSWLHSTGRHAGRRDVAEQGRHVVGAARALFAAAALDRAVRRIGDLDPQRHGLARRRQRPHDAPGARRIALLEVIRLGIEVDDHVVPLARLERPELDSGAAVERPSPRAEAEALGAAHALDRWKDAEVAALRRYHPVGDAYSDRPPGEQDRLIADVADLRAGDALLLRDAFDSLERVEGE